MIDVACASCNARFRVKDELAGRVAKCSKCGAAITIGSAADDELTLAPPPASASEAAGAGTSAGQSESQEKCPICGAALLPDAELCLSCGSEFREETSQEEARAEDEDSDRTPPEKLTEREEELIAVLPESTATRVSSSAAPYLLIFCVLATVVLVGWWGFRVFSKWRSHRRIEAAVAAVIEGGSPPSLADDVPTLPAYLESLSVRAAQAKLSNLNVQGLEYVQDASRPRFRVQYGGRSLELESEFAEDVPRSWLEAAVVSTLIVNLPADCDTSPLIYVRDIIGLPAALHLYSARTDLDWQIEKSCDPDQPVREFAAQLLLQRITSEPSDTTPLESLGQPTTVAEKRRVFERLQAERGGSGE